LEFVVENSRIALRVKFKIVALCGLVVSVLAIGPKVGGFKLGRGHRTFKYYRKPQLDFLRREVKSSVPCRKILRHIKDPYSMKEIRSRQNSRKFVAKFFLLRYQLSLLVTARALVDESGMID
jgi:hypothetical protein